MQRQRLSALFASIEKPISSSFLQADFWADDEHGELPVSQST